MKNLSLKSKIIGTSILGGLMSLAISCYVQFRNGRNLEIYKTISSVNSPKVSLIVEMEKEAILIEASLNTLLGALTTQQDSKVAESTINQSISAFNKSAKAYESLPFAEDEEAVYNKFKNQFWIQYIEEARKLTDLSGTGKESDRQQRDKLAGSEWRKLVSERDIAFNTVQDFQVKLVKDELMKVEAESKLLSWLSPLILVLAGLISIALATLFGGQIAKQLLKISASISVSASSVSSASTQIASASQSLSEAVNKQAASLQETTASLEEISSMISRSSDNAASADETSRGSQAKANEGQGAVSEMMESMKAISHSNNTIMTQIDRSNQQMIEIVKVIQEIGAKTKVINDIVFQTKLLSFNASVEAARAGEYGKGFAVVAEEVGNLAQMSGSAAKEISDMLGSSTAKVEAIVNETKSKVSVLISECKQTVDTGVTMAKRCAGVLNEIVDNVTRVTDLSQKNSVASKEQSQGVGEINKAMAQLDSVTQQNTAASQQTAAAADSLSAQAIALQDAVKELITAVTGVEAEKGLRMPTRDQESDVIKLLKKHGVPIDEEKAS